MTFGTVTATAPLRVRLDGATSDSSARLLQGVGYAPTVGARVVTSMVSGRLYVMGGA